MCEQHAEPEYPMLGMLEDDYVVIEHADADPRPATKLEIIQDKELRIARRPMSRGSLRAACMKCGDAYQDTIDRLGTKLANQEAVITDLQKQLGSPARYLRR